MNQPGKFHVRPVRLLMEARNEIDAGNAVAFSLNDHSFDRRRGPKVALTLPVATGAAALSCMAAVDAA